MTTSATAFGDAGSDLANWAYRAYADLLIALAVLTGLTGARTKVVWFEICVVLLGASPAMLLTASLL